MAINKTVGRTWRSRIAFAAPALAIAGGLALYTAGCVEIPMPQVVAPDAYFTPANGTTFNTEPAQISIVGLQGLAVCYTTNGRLPNMSNGNCAASNQELPDSGMVTLQKCGTNVVRLLWVDAAGGLFTTAGNFFIVTPACDRDGDGVVDDSDNCPVDPNADQADVDGDRIGDVCDPINDPDTDGDGVTDSTDNCPNVMNPTQTDTDGDGVGDLCEPPADGDGDGVADTADNCPTVANPDQADIDADGIGDLCDV